MQLPRSIVFWIIMELAEFCKSRKHHVRKSDDDGSIQATSCAAAARDRGLKSNRMATGETEKLTAPVMLPAMSYN